MRTLLSRRESASVVYLEGDYVYKSQPKVMTDTEYYFLNKLQGSGYVPGGVRQLEVELIRMEYIPPQSVTDADKFMAHLDRVLDALRSAEVRHGDLTEYAVLVRDNRPIIIDFAEARFMWSPLPSKRPEPDAIWLERTMRILAYGSPVSN